MKAEVRNSVLLVRGNKLLLSSPMFVGRIMPAGIISIVMLVTMCMGMRTFVGRASISVAAASEEKKLQGEGNLSVGFLS